MAYSSRKGLSILSASDSKLTRSVSDSMRVDLDHAGEPVLIAAEYGLPVLWLMISLGR